MTSIGNLPAGSVPPLFMLATPVSDLWCTLNCPGKSSSTTQIGSKKIIVYYHDVGMRPGFDETDQLEAWVNVFGSI